MELWKTIPNTNGAYEASNKGQIRSVDRYVTVTMKGKDYQKFCKGKIIKPTIRWRGEKPNYVHVWVNNKNLYAHRLVAFTWLSESYFNGAEINHKDGNPHNNCVENLEWVTRGQNELHAYRILGKKTWNSPIKDTKIRITKTFCPPIINGVT